MKCQSKYHSIHNEAASSLAIFNGDIVFIILWFIFCKPYRTRWVYINWVNQNCLLFYKFIRMEERDKVQEQMAHQKSLRLQDYDLLKRRFDQGGVTLR